MRFKNLPPWLLSGLALVASCSDTLVVPLPDDEAGGAGGDPNPAGGEPNAGASGKGGEAGQAGAGAPNAGSSAGGAAGAGGSLDTSGNPGAP